MVKSVYLNTSNPSEDGASINILKDTVDYVYGWNIIATDDDGFHLKLTLDNTWSFSSIYPTVLRIEVGSNSIIGGTDGFDRDLLISFSQSNSTYFTFLVQIDEEFDHQISRPCDSTSPYTQSYGLGNVESIAYNNYPSSREYKVMSSSFNYMSPYTYPPNTSFPLIFILDNNIEGNYMLFTYTNPGVSNRSCGFIPMTPGVPLDILLAAEEPGESINITYVNITSIVHDNSTVFPIQTLATINPTGSLLETSQISEYSSTEIKELYGVTITFQLNYVFNGSDAQIIILILTNTITGILNQTECIISNQGTDISNITFKIQNHTTIIVIKILTCNNISLVNDMLNIIDQYHLDESLTNDIQTMLSVHVNVTYLIDIIYINIDTTSLLESTLPTGLLSNLSSTNSDNTIIIVLLCLGVSIGCCVLGICLYCAYKGKEARTDWKQRAAGVSISPSLIKVTSLSSSGLQIGTPRSVIDNKDIMMVSNVLKQKSSNPFIDDPPMNNSDDIISEDLPPGSVEYDKNLIMETYESGDNVLKFKSNDNNFITPPGSPGYDKNTMMETNESVEDIPKLQDNIDLSDNHNGSIIDIDDDDNVITGGITLK